MSIIRSRPHTNRRGFLRAGSAAAAASLAASALAACRSTATAATAAPQPAQPVTTVYFQINWQESWNKTAQELCQQFTDANFNSQHKGVRAVPLQWGNGSGILTEVLAGDKAAPAVVSGCCTDFATELPILAPLDPLLRQDNMSTSLWSTGQLVTYQTPSGLYGVPAYTACQPLIYSQTIFDELGLPYPDPAWDYKAATQIWRELAGTTKTGKHRYATTMQFYPNNFDGQVYLDKGWGGNLMDATKTVCLLDQQPSVAARQWIYPLVWEKVIINRGQLGNGASAVRNGQVVMYESAGDMLYSAVTMLGQQVKWDVLPMPSWPVRRGTNVQVDHYGINAHYPDQNLAWELFKFVAAGQAVNRFLISSTLSFPNLISMWDEWMSIVRSVAPITKDKHLEYWAEAAQQGYGYGHEFFRYAPNQALNAIGPIMQKMWNNTLDPVAGCRQMAQVVNSIEKSASAEAQSGKAEAKLFPTTGSDIASMPSGI